MFLQRKRRGLFSFRRPYYSARRGVRKVVLFVMAPLLMIAALFGNDSTQQVSSLNDLVGRASVIDGDTIEIRGKRIRLWGIDAPEGRQRCFRDGKPWRCGRSSANALAGFLGARTVECAHRDTDRYGRMVAVCKVGDKDVGSWLVRNGWALDFTRYSGGVYSDEQRQAEAEKRGIWVSQFEPPWVWRRR